MMRSKALELNSDYIQALKALQKSVQQPKLGLSHIYAMLAALDYPQQNISFLHVAGTNGKGSTGAFLDSMLRAGDVHTGWFSSPHLSCARERIRIGGRPVSEADFCWAQQNLAAAMKRADLHPSYFESTFAMALLLFRKHGVRAAVLEVGLGGLYDATNVVRPRVCGITPIALDHTKILGSTLAKIARQKAGIIKSGVPIISARQSAEAAKVITSDAQKKGAPLFFIDQQITTRVDAVGRLSVFAGEKILLANAELGVQGPHQYGNAALAVAMLEQSGLLKSLDARVSGAARVRWPGRYEFFAGQPPVLMDGAHNPAGFDSLFNAMSEDSFLGDKSVVAVVGLTDGHQSKEMVRAWRESRLPLKRIIFTQSRNARALNAHAAAQLFNEVALPVSVIPTAKRALAEAMHHARVLKSTVLVTGSLYLVGELRVHFVDEASDPFLPLF